ncbi:GTPase Era [Candidatus Photodesmus katoptron]|uniref:GTPase Era n=1 Tax=Candidatus Photodesmus katoptron Akat1 TaxID=1236703 RepID=S3DI14_9GAMM|nr:GTPase Era [Candidatus Photodesmus katoptron]EPE37320.1 GTP-binding protein Era [Candidatus Photodesmus katoptron Akat1]KEY90009.1 GTPase Era [Candidatus Photodesmus katoptron]
MKNKKSSVNNLQYCGFIAIIGRPNVGKSTLMNSILGQKISITSCKPQTTRHRIIGIDTEENYQSIYLDTPGFQIKEKSAINRVMNHVANNSLHHADLLIFLVDALKWTKDDERLLIKLKNCNIPVILCINKVDCLKDRSRVMLQMQEVSIKMNFTTIIPISAKYSRNIDILKKYVRRYLPKSMHHFPSKDIIHCSQSFMASEILREKLMRFTGDELPYSLTVKIEDFDYNTVTSILFINALILVERNAQKKIVIGKYGKKIKTIGSAARIDMQKAFSCQVYLKTWVKVQLGWTNNQSRLSELGYLDYL